MYLCSTVLYIALTRSNNILVPINNETKVRVTYSDG